MSEHGELPVITPLPVRQLSIVYLCYFCEHVAVYSLNSYLYFLLKYVDIAKDPDDIGFYLGLLLAAFLAAQSIMGPFWGWLSDHVGRRKPFALSGAFGTMTGFLVFGFSRNYATAITGQILVGLFNTSGQIAPTIIGELSDPSNRGAAFGYLPIFSWLGGVVGPLIGGLLTSPPSDLEESGLLATFPFLLPNLVVCSLLAIECIVVVLFLKESHNAPNTNPMQPSESQWALWRLCYRGKPASTEDTNSPRHSGEDYHETDALIESVSPDNASPPASSRLKNLSIDLVLIIATTAITQFCASAYNKLLIDFLSSPLPVGRDLPPKESGYVWSGTALVSIAFQGLAFAKLAKLFGYARCYRTGLLVLSFSWVYTPFIGLTGGPIALWIELALGLTLRKVADITVFTCSLLLIREYTPSEDMLGLLNGLSAGITMGIQAFGPLFAGLLWSASLKNHFPKPWPLGHFLSWNVFGIICCTAFIGSLWIGKRRERAVHLD